MLNNIKIDIFDDNDEFKYYIIKMIEKDEIFDIILHGSFNHIYDESKYVNQTLLFLHRRHFKPLSYKKIRDILNENKNSLYIITRVKKCSYKKRKQARELQEKNRLKKCI